MGIKEFAEDVRERLTGKIEGISEIEIKQVLKYNSVTRWALLLKDLKSNITPTIYLEPFYARYEEDAEMDDIVRMIAKSYQESRIDGKIDFAFFKDWETIKSRVAYRLINHDRNEELLKQIPHKDVLDLAKVYYVAVQECDGSIMIYNTHLDMWGIDAEELDAVAEENTPSLCPVCVQSMWEVVEEMLGKLHDENEKATMDMLIMSNPRKVHGAATMLYPGSMEQMAERLQSNFYILPSSINEIIILPAKESDNPEHLLEMVREVNATMVGEEEILSDNVYIYNRQNREIKIV
uniref:DUF5688 family protein n=1 Tax=Acetatifactor sp. TaxID=1872090 RepID=UPI0040573CBD